MKENAGHHVELNWYGMPTAVKVNSSNLQYVMPPIPYSIEEKLSTGTINKGVLCHP